MRPPRSSAIRTTAWLAPTPASSSTAASNPVSSFISQPQSKNVETESDRLRDARRNVTSFEIAFLSRQRRPLKSNSNQVLPGRCTLRAHRSQTGTSDSRRGDNAVTGKPPLPLTAREDAGLNHKWHGGENDD